MPTDIFQILHGSIHARNNPPPLPGASFTLRLPTRGAHEQRPEASMFAPQEAA